jgi:hypothetical protein
MKKLYALVSLFLLMSGMSQVFGQSYTPGYPMISNITSDGATLFSSVNSADYVSYYVVLPDGATPPSFQDVIDGLDGAGNDGVEFGNFRLRDAGIIYSEAFGFLLPSTSYDLYVFTQMRRSPYTRIETVSPTLLEFVTPAYVPGPQIIGYNPLPNATSVPTNTTLELTFNEHLNTLASSGSFHVLNDLGEVFSFSVNNSAVTVKNFVLTVVLPTPLNYSTTYYVLIDPGFVRSASTGLSFAGISDVNQWRFTTVGAPPPITNIIPVNGSTVSTLPTIQFSFSQPVRMVDGTEITNSNVKSLVVSFIGETHSLLPENYSATINATKDTVNLFLLQPLNDGEAYTITVDRVENMSGAEQLTTTASTFLTSFYNVWLGTISTDWGNKDNWSMGRTPGAAHNVKINKTGSFDPVYTSNNTTINRLLIEPGNGLTIASGVLTVNSDVTMLSSTASNAWLINRGILNVSPANVKIYQKISSTSYWYMVSSPVLNATPANINASGVFSIWQDSNGTWQSITSSTTLEPGRGYRSYSSRDYIFSGAINNNASYTFTANYNSKNAGWGLAGNPYPCSIDWELVNISNNIKDQFHIWLNNSGQYGSYNGFVGTNLDPANPSYIPSNHAFWIRVNDISISPNSGTLTIPSTARVANRTSYLKSASAAQPPHIRLTGKKGENKDEMVVAFMPEANEGTDEVDMIKWFASGNTNLLEIYSLVESKKLAINCYTSPEGSKTIPLGIKTQSSGTFSIELTTLVGIPQETIVRLIDKKDPLNPVVTNLSSVGSYTFTSNSGTFDNRFILELVSGMTTGTSKTVNPGVNLFANDNVLSISLPELENPVVELYDLSGKLFDKKQLQPMTLNSMQVNKVGPILVKVVWKNGVFAEKVLIKE